MPNVLQVPVGVGVASLVWNGRPAPGVNSLMLINQDLNNIVNIGNDPGITATTANTVPLAPNGTISVDPASPWYVVGAAAGIKPLVMVPNGQAYFLGITQGLGNLAIPSIQSPNFVHNVTGWQIDQNGNAEFNNLQLRGTFLGLDFIINSNGAFFYNGTPALGNLKISIVSNGGGTDQFGNVYLDNIATYNVAIAGGGYAQIAANPSTGIPFLVLEPPGTTHISAPPQINSGAINGGAVNESAQMVVTSGDETGGGSVPSFVQLVSRANDGSSAAIAGIVSDIIRAKPLDGNNYSVGRFCARTTATITINSASAQSIISVPVIAQAYRVRIHLILAVGGTALTSVIAFNTGTATCSNCIGTDRRARGSTSADVVRPINGNAYPGGNTLALAASETSTYEFEGIITFSGAGTLLVVGTTSTASYAIATNSYIELLNIQ